MADNVSVDPGTTPSVTVAADNIAGVNHQRVKISVGDDGVAADLGPSNPLPVSDAGGSLTVDGTVTANIGTVGTLATESTQTAQSTLYGGVTETAPASDTASSGLNGRLQRIAQRLSSLIALLPGSLGQKTMANGLAVTIASDQSAIPVSGSISVTGTMPVDSSHAEDAAHVSGDVGAFVLAVRNDAGTALAGTTGDYIPLSTDSSGNLRVTGGGGGTQFAEDAAHTTGDLGTMALGVRKDTAAALAGTDGDYQPAIFDASGRQHVNVGTSVLPTGAATETSVALSATALGAPADAAATTTGSVIAQLRRIANLVAGTLTVSGTVTTTPPSNASTNIAQVAGATVAQGHGTAATALRVELPTDGTGVVGLATGSNTIGALTANQTVNAAQINGVTPLMGAGVTGTGSPRVTAATAGTGAAPTAFTATSSTQIFASNAARRLFTVYNNSDKDLYLMLASAAASATSYHAVVKAGGGYFETVNYSGEIRGIMSGTITSGQVNPGEFT